MSNRHVSLTASALYTTHIDFFRKHPGHEPFVGGNGFVLITNENGDFITDATILDEFYTLVYGKNYNSMLKFFNSQYTKAKQDLGSTQTTSGEPTTGEDLEI